MIPAADYLRGNMADYTTDLIVIAVLALIGCSASTILLVWAICALSGMRVTYINAQKAERGEA